MICIKRLRDAGNFEATVVYREFVIDEEVQEEKATEKAVEEKSTNKEIVEEESSKKTSPKKDEGGEEEGNKEEEVSNDPLIADKSKEDMEEEEEQCELPGMNNSNDGEEEASNGEGVISEEEVVSPKKSKDRRGSWNMTQTILQDKRANATANLMSQEEFDELVIRYYMYTDARLSVCCCIYTIYRYLTHSFPFSLSKKLFSFFFLYAKKQQKNTQVFEMRKRMTCVYLWWQRAWAT